MPATSHSFAPQNFSVHQPCPHACRCPSPPPLPSPLRRTYDLLPETSPGQLPLVLWSLSQQQLKPPAAWLEQYIAHIFRSQGRRYRHRNRVDVYPTPFSKLRSTYSAAQATSHPHSSSYSQPRVPSPTPAAGFQTSTLHSGAASYSYSYSHNSAPSHPGASAAYTDTPTPPPPVTLLGPSNLARLLVALVKVQPLVRKAHVAVLVQEVSRHLPLMGAREMTTTAWSLSHLKAHLSWEVKQQFVSTTLPALASLNRVQMANMLWGMAKLRVVPSRSWLVAAGVYAGGSGAGAIAEAGFSVRSVLG